MSAIHTLFDKTERARYRRPDRELVPRRAVQGMLALMFGAVAMVSYAQITGRANTGVLVEAEIAATRTVQITGDRVSGVYVVSDLDGTQIASSADDKAGFIGVVGLVLNRDRLTNGVEGSPPVRIVRRVNGNIAIIDDATGMVIELIGYGADNVAAFARIVN